MLNQSQQKAVNSISGPVMVIAGPGSGKTQVLTQRIIHLIQDLKVDPSEILCLTYTESGAANMKARIEKNIGQGIDISNLKIFTFHGFCDYILKNSFYRNYFSELDIENLNIATDLAKVKVMNEIFLEYDFPTLLGDGIENQNTSRILSKISQIKRDNISKNELQNYLNEFKSKLDQLLMKNKYENLNQFFKTKKTERKGVSTIPKAYKNYMRLKEFIELFDIYNSKLKERNLIDFEDMISIVVDKFDSDKNFLGLVAERLKYILIDEFQDTNEPQNRIANMIVEYWDEIGQDRNIFVVGDDDQSIYSFQGALPDNFKSFQEIYPDTEILILDINYRSTQDVIDISRSLMKDQNRFEKKYISGKEILNDSILTESKLVNFTNYQSLLNYLFETIKQNISEGGKYSDFGIIYPKNKFGFDLVQEFDNQNIPYSIRNGDDILFHDMTGHILDCLKVICNIENQISVYSLKSLNVEITNREELLEKINKELVNAEESKNYSDFFQILKDITKSIFPNIYHNHIESLFGKLETFFENTEISTLESFISDIELLRANNINLEKNELDMNSDTVKLTTAHSSKGLEFKYVFLIGFSKYDWEQSRDSDLFKLKEVDEDTKNEKLNERRRLLYVAMTRAEERLYLLNHIDNMKITKLINDLDLKKEDLIDEQYRSLNTIEYEPNIKLIDSENTIDLENYGLEEEIIAKLKLSPTSFNDYLECPYRFKLKHVLKIRNPKLDFIFGNPIHRALELFWKSYKENQILPTSDELFNHWEIALREDLTYQKLHINLKSKQKEKGKLLLEIYYRTYSELNLFHTPYLVESFLGYRDDLIVDDIPIQGKIDRVDQVGNDLIIVDNKTGAHKSVDKLTSSEESRDLKYRNQLLFYKLLLEADKKMIVDYKVKVLRLDFIEPDENLNIDIIDMSEILNDFEEFRKNLYQIWSEIKIKKFMKTQNLDNCEYCDYKDHCWPSGKIGYKK